LVGLKFILMLVCLDKLVTLRISGLWYVKVIKFVCVCVCVDCVMLSGKCFDNFVFDRMYKIYGNLCSWLWCGLNAISVVWLGW
jgi:hypothetical protein